MTPNPRPSFRTSTVFLVGPGLLPGHSSRTRAFSSIKRQALTLFLGWVTCPRPRSRMLSIHSASTSLSRSHLSHICTICRTASHRTTSCNRLAPPSMAASRSGCTNVKIFRTKLLDSPTCFRISSSHNLRMNSLRTQTLRLELTKPPCPRHRQPHCSRLRTTMTTRRRSGQ